jgi:aspartokinase/homoserine dehydrogenase 1
MPFLFETNVEPDYQLLIIPENLVASGDKINKIQAVLSGV